MNVLDNGMIPSEVDELKFSVETNEKLITYKEHLREDGIVEIALVFKSGVYFYYNNGILIRKVSVDFDVLDVLWVTFSPLRSSSKQQDETFYAVVGESNIFFHNTSTGYPIQYTFPFKCRKVYASKHGMIVERHWESVEQFEALKKDFIYIYSLSHPLDELKPVVYKPSDGGSVLFCWERESIQIVDCIGSCVLVYDRVRKCHHLYKLRRRNETDLNLLSLVFNRVHVERKPPTSTNLQSTPQSSTPVTTGFHLTQGRKTRSMMRMNLARNRPMESPALSAIGSPVSHLHRSFCESPASIRFRLDTDVTSTSLHMTNLLAKDHDNELQYADYCLECFWTESQRDVDEDRYPATFSSYSFVTHSYINFLVAEQKVLKMVRLKEVDKSSYFVSSVHSLACVNAIALKDGSTLIHELNNTLCLYSGTMKCSEIDLSTIGNWTSLNITPAQDCLGVVFSGELTSYRLTLPSMYGDDDTVEQLFYALYEILPHDKAMKLASEWRMYSPTKWFNWQRPPICGKLHHAFHFLLKQIGIVVDHCPYLPLRENPFNVNDSPQAKQMRPPRVAESDKKIRCLSFGITNGKQCLFPSSQQTRVSIIDTAPLVSNMGSIFAVLHAVWENMMLTRNFYRLRKDFVYYLYICAHMYKLDNFVTVYKEDYSFDNIDIVIGNTDAELPIGAHNRYLSPERPLSIRKTIFDVVYNKPMYRLPMTVHRTAQMLCAIAIGVGRVKSANDLQRLLGKPWAKRLQCATKQEEEVLKIVQHKNLTNANKCGEVLKIFNFNKDDLAELPSSIGLVIASLLQPDPAAVDSLFDKKLAEIRNFPFPDEVDRLARLRWPNDLRMVNAVEMLDSSKPILINTDDITSSEFDGRDAHDNILAGAHVRYTAQSFGRSFEAFRTTAPTLTTVSIKVPELCMAARLFPSNHTIELTSNEIPIRAYRDWGEFYNGISGSLCVGDASQVKVEGEWIMSICRDNEKISAPTRAGLLYGFGLNGHIVHANKYDVHGLLSAIEDLQSISLLLGYSVAKMGSADNHIFKMISTQLPFMMGPTLLPISITPLIQTAAISSLGLLFAGTGRLNIAKRLVNEIARSPSSEDVPSLDRYAYKLSAGFSVGLICLSQGNDILEGEPCFGGGQPTLIARLLVMMNGGPKSECTPPVTGAPINEFLSSLPATAMYNSESSSHIWEKDDINTHLTSHPATIALGFMFMRSNNVQMAKHLALPNTITALETIRPDLIFVRTLCRNLVMFDHMEVSYEWIESQVPPCIMRFMHEALKWHDDEDLIVTEQEDKCWEEVVDRETIAQVYLYTVTGACVALMLKHISSSPSQKEKVFNIVERFAKILYPDNDTHTHSRVRECAGVNVVSLCMSTMILYMAVLMAGTGDLRTLQIIRMWRMFENIDIWARSARKHHEQLAVHNALGMLFMSDGRAAFKGDNLSIALLVISFYPIINHNITDNRFYHQPLRYMWTKAVEERILVPVAPDTKVPIVCDIKLKFKNEPQPVVYSGPTLLPCLDVIEEIEIGGGIYQTLRYRMDRDKQLLQDVLTKSHGRITIEFQTLSTPQDSEMDGLDQFDDILEDSPLNPQVLSITKQNEWFDKMTCLSDAFAVEDKATSLSWPRLESIPTVKEHLRNCQFALSHPDTHKDVISDLHFIQKLESFLNEPQLLNRLNTELYKV